MRIIATLILISVSCQLFASTSKLHSQISHVDKKIHHTEQQLKLTQHQQHKLTKELASLETNMGNINVSLSKTNRQLRQQQQQVNTLQQKQHELVAARNSQQQSLQDQLTCAYSMSNKNTIKMLLNQEDPQKVDRMLVYTRYLNNYRNHAIKRLDTTLAQLEQTQRDLVAASTELQQTQANLTSQQAELKQQQDQRQHILARLNSQALSTTEKLKQLNQDKAGLEKMLAKLMRKSKFSDKYFVEHRNQLPWPLKGQPLNQFGDPIHNSQLKHTGILLTAAEGAAVKAIAPGKVVFADWMPGYGLLIIIDHGNNYMSVYGRNRSLNRKVGERVAAGDLVAQVGQSGGFQKPTLYFSIRHNGKPLDPSQWCSKKGFLL